MKILNLGKLPGQQSMLGFHALARLGFEGLVIVSPSVPLVSVGYFQDAEKEVDLDYCNRNGIPVMRREIGGGATYLDGNQIFYQVIWNRENKKFPLKIDKIFEFLSEPPCETYREFGIETSFRSANDIITKDGRKIAGEGGGDIGDSMVFVGGILMDFDYETMSKVLKVPDEKFRDKIYKSMEENLTTMKRELGSIPPRDDIVRVLAEKFEKLLGAFETVTLTPETIDKMVELERWLTSPEFMFRKTPKIPKGVKIKEGVEILYGTYKAKGGLIRTAQEVEKSIIKDIGVSGDFTLYPKKELFALEETLKDTERESSKLKSKIEDFYEETGVQTPGVEPEDITKAIEAGK
ncbi:lipoate--protein ligase family protein [bacterium]|nr:MAG: lipoate--protein ligase family protein [bacterium]